MNDRRHFAVLLHAADLDIVTRKELIAAADARIVEVEKPEDWLIELSANGESSELNQLARREFKHVSFEVLRLAYKAWAENRITEARLRLCCKKLLQEGTTGHEDLPWHQDLLGVDDTFDLAESGVLDPREVRRNVRVTMERVFRQLPCDWAEGNDLLELFSFASPIYRDGFVTVFLDFVVPKRDEFRDWWCRRGPAVIERQDGQKTKAVVEFQVGLLQLKGIRDRKNFKPGDGQCLIAMLPDVTTAEAPIGSKLLVTPELWDLILG